MGGEHSSSSEIDSTAREIPLGWPMFAPEADALSQPEIVRMLSGESALDFGAFLQALWQGRTDSGKILAVDHLGVDQILDRWEGEIQRFGDASRLLDDIEHEHKQQSATMINDVLEEAGICVEKARNLLTQLRREGTPGGFLDRFAYYMFRLGTFYTIAKLLPTQKQLAYGLDKACQFRSMNRSRSRPPEKKRRVVIRVKELLREYPNRQSYPLTGSGGAPLDRVICHIAAVDCDILGKNGRPSWNVVYKIWNQREK